MRASGAPGTVGFPLPGVSVRLLNPAGEAVADGETGEIHLRGPNVFAGYWRREEATRAAFADGYFRTGDLATRSPDGYYTLCGRQSDLIISGGFNIYPREIEEFLQEQPEDLRSGRQGRARSGARRSAGGICGGRQAGFRCRGSGGALPRLAGIVQDSPPVRGGGKPAAQCARESAKALAVPRCPDRLLRRIGSLDVILRTVGIGNVHRFPECNISFLSFSGIPRNRR